MIAQSVERGMFVRERPGTGSGTLLFVHGLGESGLCFEHLLVHAGLRHFHLLIPDLPGYGRSKWTDEPLPLRAQTDHLAAWIAGRGNAGPSLTLVGHSMGGVLGILFAERHPERLGCLVNVDGNLSPEDCVFSGRAAERPLEEFLAGGFDRLRETVYRQGAKERAQRGYYASMRLCDPRLFHLHSLELVQMSAGEDLARRMSALSVKRHYLAGVPRGASARSRELLKEAQVPWTAIEPSGHWPFLDRPDAFVEALAGTVA